MGNFQQFYAMLKDIPVSDKDELKATLVSRASNGRTTHLHELTPAEHTDLLLSMRGAIPRPDDERRHWRHVCLSLMRDYGVQTDNWQAINLFVLNPRIAGKDFRSMKLDELQQLSVKLRAMIKKNYLGRVRVKNEE